MYAYSHTGKAFALFVLSFVRTLVRAFAGSFVRSVVRSSVLSVGLSFVRLSVERIRSSLFDSRSKLSELGPDEIKVTMIPFQ